MVGDPGLNAVRAVEGEGRREVIYHSLVQCKLGTKESKLKERKFLVGVLSVFCV